ncbi:enoyl-CoA hydratase/isomerase family protein [Palleronia sp. KMU-117]|uniref:enoyl-CoA hydratase/isomerase family protein n=1 Tax=Palleronia sp. KMU-117 TaxID=3434108 RepID=UPI003D722153
MIEVTQDGALWTFRLNRPDKANALTRQMLADLALAVPAAREQAKAVILTGAGTVFSAGADLDAARAGLATDPVWEELSGAIADLPCLTIAALNGTVAGGAFGMVLACDLRIAVPEARFFYPVMKLGFLPQPSDPARLVALVGPSRARLILMAGARIGASDALTFGLVDEIVEGDRLLARSRELAADALGAAPDHAAAIKRMCRD